MPRFEPVRVVVVGVGDFGRRHARTLSGLAEADLVGVVDSQRAAVGSLQKDIPDLRVWTNLDEALERSSADAYIIATRTESHIPLAQKILAAGKRVLVEKPLTTDVEQAATIQKLVAPDSSNLLVGHILLFSPLLKECLSQVKQLGGVKFFQAVRHRPTSKQEIFPEETPLRMMMVHDLYVACAMMQGEEPLSFAAWLHPTRCAATAELRWRGGACGSFAASFLTPPGQPSDGFDRMEIFGEGFSARVALNPQPLELWTDKASWPVALDVYDDPQSPSGWLAEELRHFCRVVRGAAKVPLGARYQDAIQVQRWLDKLEAIAKEGDHHAG